MKWSKIIGTILSFAVLVCAAIVYLPAEYFVLERNGSIEWAQKTTSLKLKKYEVLGTSREIQDWLLKLDGAPGEEAAVTFLVWGLDNQNDFDTILKGIDPEKRTALFTWLAETTLNRGLDESFLQAFETKHLGLSQSIEDEINRIRLSAEHR